MKIFKNKEMIKLIINFLCLLIILLFYLLSPLLKTVFEPWVVILSLSVSFITLALQLIFKLINKEKITNIFCNINEYVQVLLVAVVIIEFVFTFIMFPATVSQNSMLPTLNPDDKLIISCTSNIDNNDIIVFEYDNTIQKDNVGVRNKELLIKRVIVKEGQSFKYIGKDLYIDGVLVEDKFGVNQMDGLTLLDICAKNNMIEECLQDDGSYVVPDGWYVVFGDNRQYSSSNNPVSIDSRAFGLVHESQIFGKVIYKVNRLFDWEKIGE